MENKDTLLRILLLAVVLLICGQAYTFFALSKIGSTGAGNDAVAATTGAPTAAPGAASSTPPTAPADILQSVGGPIASIASNSFTIAQGSQTVTIQLSAQTSIVEEGAPKSAAQQASDMQAFHAYTQQLMRDPQQNQGALENLIAPSADQETTLPLADLSKGEQVEVFGDPQSDGSMLAVKIIVTPNQGTQ